MGAERKTHYIDPKVKKMTAYHEVCGIQMLRLIDDSDSFRVAMPY